MSDNRVRIERLTNGYVVRVTDPKIQKANETRVADGKGAMKPYRDPDREFVFDTVDKVLAWLKVNLDKALPEDDYVSSFNAALEDTDNDGE